MESKIIFLKVIEISGKEGKKYFKCFFLTDGYEPHDSFIDSDLMAKIVNKKYQPLNVYKGIFKMDKEMKLHLIDVV